jgi:hypothetical protein
MDTEKWAGLDKDLFDSGQVGWNRGNSSRPYVCTSGVVGRGLFIIGFAPPMLANKLPEKEHDYEFSADDLDAATILGRA